MNLVNETVFHRQFGFGTITGQTMTIITVEFCKEYGIKKFLYPSTFESFLELCNLNIKQKMDAELQEIQKREELEREKRAEEEARRREEERRILLEQKHTAAKKQTAQKKSTKK